MASPAAVLQVFVNANTKVASAQLQAFNAQLTGVGKTSAATGAGMGKFTKGAAAAGAGVAAFGAAAIVAGKQLYDLGVEFDAAYDKIRVGTGATGQELEKLKGNFRSVAKNVPNDFEEVGTAIADLNTRLGLTGKPLERMAENMLHLSNITGDDLERNIKAVSRAFVDWEVTVPQQTKYLDGLFRLSQKSGASVSELADSAQRLGSPLRQLGFSFGETAAMFANFERAGVNTQTMMPGLKMAISNLTRPTEGLAQQMGKLGIEVGKPDKALRQVFDLLGDSTKLSNVEKTGLAMDVFGKRAGADMAEAIKQGRFEVDSYLKIFRDGRGDTIRKAADETYDFSENVSILANNLKIFLEPAANAVFVALDDMTRAMRQAVREMDGTSKRSTTMGNILKVVSELVYALGKAYQLMFRTAKRMIEGVIDVMRGFWGVVKNIVGLIVSLIKGDFRKAWESAKNIVRSAIRAIGGIVKFVTAPVRSAFQTVFEIVRDKFKAAFNAAVTFVNGIIRVINKIPGVPDIGMISGAGASRNFGEGSSQRGAPPSRPGGLQRGGFLMGGQPSGDSIPAMLERGEYVLNREAVKKIGLSRLNDLNFRQAARFQTGGQVKGDRERRGVIPGVFKLAGKAFDLISKGPGAFLDLLPDPNLPEPIKGLGPWLIGQVSTWIKDKVKSLFAASGGGTMRRYAMLSGDTDFTPALGFALSKMAKATGQSIYVQSGFRSYAEQAALYQAYLNGTGNLAAPPGSSNHESGRAADITPGREVFGSVASKFGLGFTVPSESWHIELMRRGGAVGMQRGGFVGNINKIWPESNSAYGNWGGPTLPSYVVAALAQAAGMPGRTMEQVTRGESGAHAKHTARPGATGIDPGGTKGHGLWMITSGYNEDLAAKVGGWNKMLNPVINAWAASQIYRRQGLGAWYGTGSVSGDRLNYTGKYDIANALGGLSYRGALHFATKGALGEKPKSIAAIRKGAARAIKRVGGLRGRYEGVKGFLNAAVKNANKAKELAGEGEITRARERLDKARMQIRKAVNKGKPVGGGKPGKPAKPKKPGIPEDAVIFPEPEHLERNRRLIAQHQERIDLFDRESSAPWSPGGFEKDQAEIDQLRSLYQTLLEALDKQRLMVIAQINKLNRMIEDRRERIAEIMEQIEAWRYRIDYLRQNIEEATQGQQVKDWRKRAEELEKKLQGSGTPQEKKAWKAELKDVREKIKKKVKPVKGWRDQIKKLTGKIGNAREMDIPAYREFIEEMTGRVQNDLGPELDDLRGVTGKGGRIADVRWELLNLANLVPWTPDAPEEPDPSDPSEPPTSPSDDSALLDLLRQQLVESQRALAIAEAQMPIFQQYMPRFHQGGVVQGPMGAERPVMAQAGEGIFTREQMRAMGSQNITVVIEDAAIDSNRIRVEVDGVIQEKVSTVRRQGSNRRFATR